MLISTVCNAHLWLRDPDDLARPQLGGLGRGLQVMSLLQQGLFQQDRLGVYTKVIVFYHRFSTDNLVEI